jgi:hypothetical protein
LSGDLRLLTCLAVGRSYDTRMRGPSASDAQGPDTQIATDGAETGRFHHAERGGPALWADPPRCVPNLRPPTYLMRSKILKMGMYRAMIIDPTRPPRIAIMMGSMSAVSWSVVDSTSWS